MKKSLPTFVLTENPKDNSITLTINKNVFVQLLGYADLEELEEDQDSLEAAINNLLERI